MDIIKFVIEYYRVKEFEYDLPNFNIYINDQNLIDLLSRIDIKDWNGEKDSRSSYIGIEVSHIERFRNEMLGKKIYPHSILLTCTCSIEECNCIMTDINFKENTVTWSNLRSPWLGGNTYSPFGDEADAIKEGWVPIDYSRLGPFVFDRAQYASALEQVVDTCRMYKPKEHPNTQTWSSLLDLLNDE